MFVSFNVTRLTPPRSGKTQARKVHIGRHGIDLRLQRGAFNVPALRELLPHIGSPMRELFGRADFAI